MASDAMLREARRKAGWTQQQAAAKAGVSQSYLALLEAGRRRVVPKVARRLARVYGLPAALPLEEDLALGPNASETLAGMLAALGYPGFAYMRGHRQRNPASVLLAGLGCEDLEARVIEGLVWLVMRYPEMDWDWLEPRLKTRNLQNRCGFVANLGARTAASEAARAALQRVEARLEPSRLAREDTLCQRLTEAETRWLRESRPAEARHWNVLIDLVPQHVRYAA